MMFVMNFNPIAPNINELSSLKLGNKDRTNIASSESAAKNPIDRRG